MADFLKDYGGLPAALFEGVQTHIARSPPSCGADLSDCSTDGSCGDYPSCSSDLSDCSSDGSSCTKDGCSDKVCSDILS